MIDLTRNRNLVGSLWKYKQCSLNVGQFEVWGFCVCVGCLFGLFPLGVAGKHLSFGDGCEIYTKSLNTLLVRLSE